MFVFKQTFQSNMQGIQKYVIQKHFGVRNLAHQGDIQQYQNGFVFMFSL